MRFNINLASRPYEDAARFYRAWLPLLALLAVVTVALAARAFMTFRESRTAVREIAKIDNRLAELDKLRADAERTLAEPQNAGTRDAAHVLNTAFKRKSFSWTQVLSDLERIMPTGVQVISIKPQLRNGETIVSAMEVAGSNHARILELIRRMESSPQFTEAAILSEQAQDDGTLVAAIQANYVPSRGR